MNTAVLGTGIVAKTLAARLAAAGHAVTLGTRDVAATRARTAPGRMGDPPVPEFLTNNPAIQLATFADAARGADLVILAVEGNVALSVLDQAGADALAGKVLVDLTNPLDVSAGMPPRLFVANDDSLGEQIQRAYPASHVVKTLNTVSAHLMVDPRALAGGDHTMFLCGDDPGAKAVVLRVLREDFGWTDLLDLGDISNARGMEATLLLWTRVWIATGSANFAWKVVR
jgi:predicted dinucleotide-binding enzyme